MRTIKHLRFCLAVLVARAAVPALAGWLAFIIPSGDARASIALKTIASGLDAPLYVTSAGDSSGRLFIVSQSGRISTLSGGKLLFPFFLDIMDRVRIDFESGLLGLAFHANFRTNGRFFIYYTRDGPSGFESVLAEYAVSPENANLASTTSEQILLVIQQPVLRHDGGMLAFGAGRISLYWDRRWRFTGGPPRQ